MFSSAEDQKRFVAEQMQVERQAREQRRQFEEQDRARKRQGSREAQELTFGELREEVLRYQGQTKAAEEAKRENDRMRDDTLRKEQKRKYVDDGFGADEAAKMAERDVVAQQAARRLEELKRAGSGTIVASSLARIGGGGNVTGTDPVAARIDITNKLLEQIRDQRAVTSQGVE
jgi:hypothetical protein